MFNYREEDDPANSTSSYQEIWWTLHLFTSSADNVCLFVCFFYSTVTQTVTPDHMPYSLCWRSIIAFFSSIIVILFLIFIINAPFHITVKKLQLSLSSLGRAIAVHKLMITTAHMKHCICSLSSNVTYQIKHHRFCVAACWF